jgi:hypothetical protein
MKEYGAKWLSGRAMRLGHCYAEWAKVVFEIFEEANWADVMRDADVSASKRRQSMS